MDWLLLAIAWMLSSNKHDKLQQERNVLLRAALTDEALLRLDEDERLAMARAESNWRWGLSLGGVAVIVVLCALAGPPSCTMFSAGR